MGNCFKKSSSNRSKKIIHSSNHRSTLTSTLSIDSKIENFFRLPTKKSIISSHRTGDLSHSKSYYLESELIQLIEMIEKGQDSEIDDFDFFVLSDYCSTEILSVKSRLAALSFMRTYSRSSRISNFPVTFEDGSIYIGQISKNFEREGYGYYISSDGSLYEGSYKNDKKWGTGRLITKEGAIFQGEWVNNQFEGLGIYYKKGKKSFNGQWVNSKKNGLGVEVLSDGTKFEGNFISGVRTGPGKLTLPNGVIFKGNFVKNKLNGLGTQQSENEKKYRGCWVDNKKTGKGVMTWPDGRKYEGDFFQDKKHGYGVMSYPDGRSTKGFWQNGNLSKI